MGPVLPLNIDFQVSQERKYIEKKIISSGSYIKPNLKVG